MDYLFIYVENYMSLADYELLFDTLWTMVNIQMASVFCFYRYLTKYFRTERKHERKSWLKAKKAA